MLEEWKPQFPLCSLFPWPLPIMTFILCLAQFMHRTYKYNGENVQCRAKHGEATVFDCPILSSSLHCFEVDAHMHATKLVTLEWGTWWESTLFIFRYCSSSSFKFETAIHTKSDNNINFGLIIYIPCKESPQRCPSILFSSLPVYAIMH